MTEAILSHLSTDWGGTELRAESASMDPIRHVIAGHELSIFSRPNVFRPTSTTWLLTEQALKNGVEGKSALDLGCGSGPIAIALALAGASHVHATDLMPEACELARKNCEANEMANQITILQGDLFESVPKIKFDVIVNDVSGVAESVARLSSWFPDGVPLAGTDGTTPTIKVLEQAEEYLSPGGRLYFPVISLCASNKIVDTAVRLFGNRLSRVASKMIPFNQELKDHLDTLVEMRKVGLIGFEQIRTRLVWTLDIYCAVANI